VAAPAFLSGEAKEGGQDILGGQVYMVAHNALPQYGTHAPLFKEPYLPPDLSFLFASCCSFPFHLSFIPISRPSPTFILLARGLGERCKLPQRVRGSPAAKWNLVNSGPRNQRFLTCQSGNYSVLKTLFYILFDSVTAWTVLVSSQTRYSIMLV